MFVDLHWPIAKKIFLDRFCVFMPTPFEIVLSISNQMSLDSFCSSFLTGGNFVLTRQKAQIVHSLLKQGKGTCQKMVQKIFAFRTTSHCREPAFQASSARLDLSHTKTKNTPSSLKTLRLCRKSRSKRHVS